MGIPSYFNFLLKNHQRILTQKKHNVCDDLFIDANSLIYDSIDSNTYMNDFDVLYKKVYEKVIELIKINNPTGKTFVCFDGVPPFPKMLQQRQRRFKSVLTKQILTNETPSWNTNHITPGTEFMIQLDLYLTDMFKNEKNIVFSGSGEKGEGEHKICHLIRSQSDSYIQKNIVIYGLDADLIMLGLLLQSEGFQIYLYKETKHFSYISQVDPESYYYFDISVLGKEIHTLLDTTNERQAICDYIFLCFLCGNDFMPHVPAIHIRNNGIQLLIEKYKLLNRNIINTTTKTIQWSSFHIFLTLFKEEDEYISQNLTWKLERKRYIKATNDEDKLNALPCMDIEKEKYLLNHLSDYNSYILNHSSIEDVCNQYLRILEWTWYYYNGIEKNDYIHYSYAYGPRFQDLVRYTPLFDTHQFSLSDPILPALILRHLVHVGLVPVYYYPKGSYLIS